MTILEEACINGEKAGTPPICVSAYLRICVTKKSQKKTKNTEIIIRHHLKTVYDPVGSNA
jgi:hypothetical protein